MIDPDRIREFVEWTWDEAALPVLMEYTTIPALSPAFDPDWQQTGALHDAARLLYEWAINRPIETIRARVVEADGRTPMLVVAAGGQGPCVLLYGHLDKQPPLGDWSDGLDPFKPVRHDDRLYGRGTADDGYALFAALIAMEAAQAANATDSHTSGSALLPHCIVIIEASEESGSPDLAAHLNDLQLPTPDLVICLDSGCVSYDRLWITTSLRGLIEATLRVEVLTHGVHSGAAGGIVPSSFRISRQLLSRIEDEKTGGILLPDMGEPVSSTSAESISKGQEFLDDAAIGSGSFPAVTGLRLAGRDSVERRHLEAHSAALEITGGEGIPPIAQAGNVLRPFTELKLSMRLPPVADAEAAATALRRILTEDPPDGARISVNIREFADGWLAPPLSPPLARTVEEASLAYFGNAPGSLGLGGSIPFVPTLQRRFPETQFLATGVLGPGSNAHGPDEYLSVRTAKSVTACVAHLLATMANGSSVRSNED